LCAKNFKEDKSTVKISRLNLLRSSLVILVILSMALLLTTGAPVSSQTDRFRSKEPGLSPVAQRIEAAKLAGKNFPKMELFQRQSSDIYTDRKLAKQLRSGTLLDFDFGGAEELARAETDTLTLALPDVQRGNIELELQEVNILPADFQVINGATGQEMEFARGKHYRGVVKGQSNSLVALSVFPTEVMGLISTGEGNLVLGKLKGASAKHLLYNDRDLLIEAPFTCGTVDDNTAYTADQLTFEPDAATVAACAKIYVEVDYDIYQNKGSSAATTSYITGLFGQSAALYQNESINITLASPLVIWTTRQESPYGKARSSSQLLSRFQSRIGSNGLAGKGDLGHLVALRGGGGIAAGFNGFCSSNDANSVCFSGINSTYNNVPTYSWSVEVFTHEMGHLMGSRHTHACVWNGNNTAIDGCNTTEGGCPRPPTPGSAGGTIMSYCHLVSGVGINFNNGFGPQPGNVIRSRYNGASCLCQ
jgi:hypothetical protein